MKPYIFTSERLGFRSWSMNDLEEFAVLNSDKAVMRYFPKPLTKEETAEFIDRLQKHYEKYGYNYFATEFKDTGELIGFIGLAYQVYESPFTPCTDIGWRLKKSAWGKGYATEGAMACLDYAYNELNINRIISTCTLKNKPSENVMQKIGMFKKGTFMHPRLAEYPEMQECVIYEILK